MGLYHAGFDAMAPECNLTYHGTFSTAFCLVLLCLFGVFCASVGFRVVFSVSVKICHLSSERLQWIAFGSMAAFTVLKLQTSEHGKSLL